MAVMPSTRREFVDRGVEFTNAFATTPLCCPSRASIYSGKYPHNHGIRKNGGIGFDATQTWQRQLDDAGYFTGLFGKYFFSVLATQAPYFDVKASVPAQAADDAPIVSGYARSFLEQAEQDDERPWALVLATSQPHAPWTGTPATFSPLPPWTAPPSFQEADLSDKNPSVAALAAGFARRGPEWPVEVRDGQRTELQQVDEMVATRVRRPRRARRAPPDPRHIRLRQRLPLGRARHLPQALALPRERPGAAVHELAGASGGGRPRRPARRQHRPRSDDHGGGRPPALLHGRTADPCSRRSTGRGCCSRARSARPTGCPRGPRWSTTTGSTSAGPTDSWSTTRSTPTRSSSRPRTRRCAELDRRLAAAATCAGATCP